MAVSGFVHAASGNEYFVAPDGDDQQDGKTPDTAFATVQRGIEVLAPGDILTLAPGEYFGNVVREDLGHEDHETIIRAEIPGTAVLRGDVPAPAFQKMDAHRWIYAADFDQEVHGVNDLETLRTLQRVMSVAEVEFQPGSFYYDDTAKRLYISTTDMRPPTPGRHTVSVTGKHGLHLLNPVRVTMEGLVTTGFNADVDHQRREPGYGVTWGIFLLTPRDCVIRDGVSYLNRGGIAYHRMGEGGGNLIERCRVYANPGAMDAGAGIKGHSADDDEIRDSYVYLCGDIGIGFYGQGIRGPAVLRGNLAWGNGTADLRIKGAGHEGHLAEKSIAFGNLDVRQLDHCLLWGDNIYNREPGLDTIMLVQEEEIIPDQEFVDPENLDFRLQATSRFRGAGPEGTDRGPYPFQDDVFFVRSGGDDSADGLSMRNAWRTLAHAMDQLKPGDTLYLESGEYDCPDLTLSVAGESPVYLRGRGVEPAVIHGPLTVETGRNIVLERLDFTDTLSIRGSGGIVVRHCRFRDAEVSLRADQVDGLRILHSEFYDFHKAAVEATGCRDLFLSGNWFENSHGPALRLDDADTVGYSDYNGFARMAMAWQVNGAHLDPGNGSMRQERYSTSLDGGELEASPAWRAGRGPAGKPLGVFHEYRPRTVVVSEPVVHSVTDTTANLEWWTSDGVTCEVAWGETAEMENRALIDSDGFAAFSLTDLSPGQTYYFQVLSSQPIDSVAARRVHPAGAGEPIDFQTLTSPTPPVVYHVAPDGDDARSGLSRADAFRTVNRAAAEAGPGDTVLIHEGVYTESIRVRATGTEARPVTFKAAPGAKVVFDGANRSMDIVFQITGKQHINLDGFYFQMLKHAGWRGAIQVIRSDHVSITRCLLTGRGRGTSACFVYAEHASDLTIRNCALIMGYEGIVARGCPNLRVENNVFLRNLIQALIINNGPDQKVVVKNNIFCDSTRGKDRGFYLEFARVESLQEGNNVFYMRLPDEERRPFAFYGDEQYERAAEAYDIPIVYPEPSRITELTRLTLAEYQERFEPASGSFFGNPVFARLLEMDEVDLAEYQGDRLSTMDLEFSDLFATDPEVRDRGIGLQPEAFAD